MEVCVEIQTDYFCFCSDRMNYVLYWTVQKKVGNLVLWKMCNKQELFSSKILNSMIIVWIKQRRYMLVKFYSWQPMTGTRNLSYILFISIRSNVNSYYHWNMIRGNYIFFILKLIQQSLSTYEAKIRYHRQALLKQWHSKIKLQTFQKA